MYSWAQPVTETLSVRIDAGTKRKLEALAKNSRRSKSFLASEAISAYVELEAGQLGEIQAGVADSEAGNTISHERVGKWLRSWGKAGEGKAPK